MNANENFLRDHSRATRRYFMGAGAAGAAALALLPDIASAEETSLESAIGALPPWRTAQDDFQDVSRGKPKPHSLTEAERREVGLTRDTWSLDVVSDPDHPSRLRNPLSKADHSAFTFADLMELAQDKAVRFAKVMTCLNIGCPLGNGIWEGVPLREVLWLTQPVQDLRRVFYYGYHNDDEKQMFRSSLPVGRVLEDPFDVPPVILCYKLNGQWLSPERGGPVRVVVPEAYGFKSIKWLSHLVLSNLPHANDTYAEKNNDVDSPMKTFCATLSLPQKVTAGAPIPITGWAQAGVAGLAKVQVWIQDRSEEWTGARHFADAPWKDAQILPLSESDRPSEATFGFSGGKPSRWPMRLTRAHWATLHPGLPAGEYMVRCRTVDEKGNAQPMPRPMRKSGHAAIEEKRLLVQ